MDTDQWAQVKALLTRIESALLSAERRAEKAEQRIETLEKFIRNELFPRINTPPPPPPSPPSSPPPSIVLAQIPGIGLDLSRVAIPEIKEGNASAVRRRVNEALKGRNITCFGGQCQGEWAVPAALPRQGYRQRTQG